MEKPELDYALVDSSTGWKSMHFPVIVIFQTIGKIPNIRVKLEKWHICKPYRSWVFFSDCPRGEKLCHPPQIVCPDTDYLET